MKLSSQQIEAINHYKGPALVLAVPGAGKTTVIIHRTANLLQTKNVDPKRILSITFSKSSAKDMSYRFESEFHNSLKKSVFFSTIHSFAYMVLKDFAYQLGKNYKLIENEHGELSKYSILRKLSLKYNNDYIGEEKLDLLIGYISYVKNMLISPELMESKKEVDINNFSSIYNEYEDIKNKNNLIDFDDMLTKTLSILQNDSTMLNKYRRRFDFIQVDEGQDTSKVQIEIIKLLAFPDNNLFIVADDDQSIYGFRGAYPKWLLTFENHYNDGKIYYMEENYRSSKNIVTVCNSFIKSNKERYDKNIMTSNPSATPINVVKVKTPYDQYEYILKDIHSKNMSSNAILYRNNLSAIGLMDFFERNKALFYLRDLKTRFFSHWILKDIFNFIIFSRDLGNYDVFNEIFYKMKGYISRKQMNYIKTSNSAPDIMDRLLEMPGIPDFYRASFHQLKLDFKILRTLKPYDAIEFIENELEYNKYLKEGSMRFGHSLSSLKAILYYMKTISKNLKSFEELSLRLKELNNVSRSNERAANSIIFSTLHSSKGLEFDNVYIIDLVDGTLPTSGSIDMMLEGNAKELEEERRLFYVGMSRARSNLTLMTPLYMDEQGLKLSRFIDELKVQHK